MTMQAGPVNDSMAALTRGAADRYGDAVGRPLQARRRVGRVTYAELWDRVRASPSASSTSASGSATGSCILANTRLEFTIVDLAASTAGAIVVPVYPTNSADECEWVVGDSGATLIICENDVAGGQDRRGPLAACRTCSTSSSSTVTGRGTDHAGGARRPRRRRRRRRARPPCRRRSARRRLPDHLHVGHDRSPEGRRAHEQGLRCRAPLGRRDGAVRRTATSSTCSCRWPTCSPSSSRPTASRSARRSPSGAVTPRRSSPSWASGARRPCCRPCRASSRRSTPWRWAWCRRGRGKVGAAIELGLGVRKARRAGEDVSDERGRGVRAGRPGDVRARPRHLRRQGQARHLRGRADRPRDPRVLLRRRRPGVRGLGHDRDDGDRHAQPARRVPLRHHRPAGRRRRRAHRRRRRDRDRRRHAAARVLAQPGGDRRRR